MRRATRRTGSGSSWGRATPAVASRAARTASSCSSMEAGSAGGPPRAGTGAGATRGGAGAGGAPPEGRDVRGDHERVGGADRVAQVVDVGQDAGGHGERAGPQAVDALH